MEVGHVFSSRRPRHVHANVMDDLTKMLQEKFGLDEGVAKQVIETVLGFVKDKLPEPMQGMLDKVASAMR